MMTRPGGLDQEGAEVIPMVGVEEMTGVKEGGRGAEAEAKTEVKAPPSKPLKTPSATDVGSMGTSQRTVIQQMINSTAKFVGKKDHTTLQPVTRNRKAKTKEAKTEEKVKEDTMINPQADIEAPPETVKAQ